jgi:plastocyanin
VDQPEPVNAQLTVTVHARKCAMQAFTDLKSTQGPPHNAEGGRVMDGRRRGARVFIGLGAALWMLGAACSKSSPSNNPQQPATPASAAGITLQQGAGGLVFSPTTFSVKNGESITVTNVGSAAHTFTITGKGIDVVNDPGKSQNVTTNLAPGTYPFICRFHESLAMKGTLTVTG